LRYASAYRVPDHDDKGNCERNNYLMINSAGYYEFDETYGATHRKQGRKDYYLSYNHSGSMKLGISQNYTIIEGGTVFIYKPFEEQYYGQASNEPISNYWIHFTGYGAYELLVNAMLSEGNVFKIGISDDIPEIFETLINEINNKNPRFELLASSLLMQLVSLISRKLQINSQTQISDRNLRISESIQYIHKNYDKKISICETAKISHLSVNRYSCVFKQLMGLSPQQYIIKLRLQKACEMMRHTNLNLRQISSLVGFDDQLYFSRLFKKYENMTPSEYLNGIKSI